MQGEAYGSELQLTHQQVGEVFGASLWPIALTMIRLQPRRRPHRLQAADAARVRAAGGVWHRHLAWPAGTSASTSPPSRPASATASSRPSSTRLCAAVLPASEKTKWLAILHAAWPAGLVLGTLLILGANYVAGRRLGVACARAVDPRAGGGRTSLMYLPCKLPHRRAVLRQASRTREMLQQVGFLTAFLTSWPDDLRDRQPATSAHHDRRG
jgi:DHA2 family metal-tetracycline-proton antiporter-like MFS transporter